MLLAGAQMPPPRTRDRRTGILLLQIPQAAAPDVESPRPSQSRSSSRSKTADSVRTYTETESDNYELISSKCEVFMDTLAAVLEHEFPKPPKPPTCSCSRTVEPGRRSKKGCPGCLAYILLENVYSRIHGRPTGLRDAFRKPRIIIRCPQASRLRDLTLLVVDQLRLTDLEVVYYEST
ncbi:hypothetical protein EVG20_g6295 [Dentipellis fragilis]|uniref:Uncharacterized protein n=1 Tax=Dentipellis fragilis TaxID=205917 RepID=A0A4Y9YLP6_9AGAM|nr:hypothetical protein EVG20_g6295 [Dentipellis fragilis]